MTATLSAASVPLLRATEWLHAFSDVSSRARLIEHTYGFHGADADARLRLYRRVLEAYLGRYGDGLVLIARSPGRLNVMGRHIDHQGGVCNLIAIDRDILLVVGERADRHVRLHNADPAQFPDREFSLDELVEPIGGMAWADFVETEAARRVAAEWSGDWSLYVRAALARLQARYPDRRLKGMDIAAAGDIPVAAGLSSSSALVLATAEAAVALNGLEPSPAELVELCGEGEWYVGTRGGAADHAAMRFARAGRVVQIGFLPFRVLDTAPFPPGHQMLVCNSGQKARKTLGARDVFNQRVACYHIGREMLARAFPLHAERCGPLRDWNAENLGLGVGDVLRMLTRLPVSMCRDQVIEAIPEDVAERVLSTHSADTGPYPVRGVVLFGLSECARGEACAEPLHRGDAGAFGRLMCASHDGDRVVRWASGGVAELFAADCSDEALGRLAERSAEDGSCLSRLSGGYGCSTARIDRMVDTLLATPGVAGAQLAGAGLGGCMMALVRRDACAAAQQRLIERVYEPECVEPEMFACHAVSGSGLVTL